MLRRIKDWVSNLLVVQKVLAFIVNLGAKQLAALGLASVATVMGAGATIRTVQNQNDIQDQGRVITSQIQQIEQAGDNTQADLEALEKRIAGRIADETRAQAESLRATAETLQGNLRQTALEAADSLDERATGIDENVSITNDTLQTNVDAINEIIAGVEQAGKDADSALTVNLIDLNAARAIEIAALQTENEALPPIGSIAWVVDSTLIDSNHYLNCDGADINGNILPNVNANGLFVRGGTFDGVSNPDTTAVNGLALNTNVLTNRVGIAGGPNAAWFADTPGTVALTGDTETAPVNLTLTCVVRYK